MSFQNMNILYLTIGSCPDPDLALKGQCHEMVVEVRPWSGRLGLN
jgi:hypothetical protein